VSFSDPYGAYVEGSVFSGNPLGLVIALYEGTIQAIGRARQSLSANDPWGRAKAISKAVELLTELLISLNHEEGGEISTNLKRLYSYMQCRLLEAHAQKTAAPMDEVERLLETMLEGWRGAAEKASHVVHAAACEMPNSDLKAEEASDDYWFSGERIARPAGGVSAVF
jgi:flagellar secretion chaperone FliS